MGRIPRHTGVFDPAALMSRLLAVETKLRLFAAVRRPVRHADTVTVTTGTTGAGFVDVTFPAGKFTEPPMVFPAKQSGAGVRGIPYADSVTASGCRIGTYDPTGTATSATDVPIAYEAVQYP